MTAPTLAVRSILVALDESDRAPLVFATAAMLARSLGAQLVPLRVLERPPAMAPAARTHPDGLEAQLLREATANLQALMRTEPSIQYGPPVVVFGDPWREIVANATSFDVDLIVIGSRRHHDRLDRVLGTVAAKVVNHADRNVLVVHERGVARNR
jgi:nucleotide-binding universal stress UspA family protein